MAEGAASELRYKAFLSYSHKDAASARKVHRRLETYRLPKRLVGRVTGRGQVPRRLWPIFRDREEMAASSDLSETVREALTDSAALIVLCSPAAAASRWVAEEIRTFRALHPGSPVLAAIVAGEPPGCFPEPLLTATDGSHAEPLATDLRREGDGRHVGLLKLVAGVTGVALDDLVQRDASRRIRRVTAVTAGALVAVLIMAALTVYALDARRQAERQRADAEGLIEFMLTDLRARLRGVGSLAVMGTVNAHALRYYDAQRDLSDLPEESLLRRARVLHAIGEDEILRGDMRAALAAFHEARRTTAEQLAREPHNSERILLHARSEARIGRVYEAAGDWSGAERQYGRFALAAERLLRLAPANSAFLSAAAWSAFDLGNVHLKGAGDYAAAESAYRLAVGRFTRALRSRPSDHELLRAQANAYAGLADSYFARSMWRESLDARLQQLRLAEHLYGLDSDSFENLYRLAAARRGASRSYFKLRDPDRARQQLFQAHALTRRLLQRDPQNAEWLLLSGIVGCDVSFSDLGVPLGASQSEIAEQVSIAAARLEQQRDPRLSEIAHCARAIERSAA